MTRERKKELKNFCMEYKQKKLTLENYSYYNSVSFDEVRCSSANNKSKLEMQAIEKLELEQDIKLIENVAVLVANDLANLLIESVTNKKNYEDLDIPVSKRTFYRIKKEFFIVLHRIYKK